MKSSSYAVLLLALLFSSKLFGQYKEIKYVKRVNTNLEVQLLYDSVKTPLLIVNAAAYTISSECFKLPELTVKRKGGNNLDQAKSAQERNKGGGLEGTTTTKERNQANGLDAVTSSNERKKGNNVDNDKTEKQRHNGGGADITATKDRSNKGSGSEERQFDCGTTGNGKLILYLAPILVKKAPKVYNGFFLTTKQVIIKKL